MQLVNKFMMLAWNVSDMTASKKFYIDQLGLKVATEYRQDDDNWWVTLALPDGGATLTLARASVSPESVKPDALSLYLETSDVDAAHSELTGKGVKVNDVQPDLFGPGSGVKFFNLKDPDGNLIHIVQAHPTRAPF